MKKLLNWSELSRHITGGDRNCIRGNKVPLKYEKTIDLLIKYLRRWEKERMKVLIIVGSLLSCSCATMIHGSNQKITINTEPQGAIVIVNKQEIGFTPMVYNARRSKDFTLVLTREGYECYEMDFIKEIDPVIIGNLLFGGIPGLLIDFAGGAAYKFPIEDINIKLK